MPRRNRLQGDLGERVSPAPTLVLPDGFPLHFLSVNFEWDEDKNQENIRKHGLDFADAWEIFEAPMRTALDARADYGEDRWAGIGFLGNRIVVVVFTRRGEDMIRIISLRKALKHERKKFEEALRDRLGTH
jgi:uncharacterized protein